MHSTGAAGVGSGRGQRTTAQGAARAIGPSMAGPYAEHRSRGVDPRFSDRGETSVVVSKDANALSREGHPYGTGRAGRGHRGRGTPACGNPTGRWRRDGCAVPHSSGSEGPGSTGMRTPDATELTVVQSPSRVHPVRGRAPSTPPSGASTREVRGARRTLRRRQAQTRASAKAAMATSASADRKSTRLNSSHSSVSRMPSSA